MNNFQKLYESCVLVNINLCGKLISSLQLQLHLMKDL